MSYIGDTRKIVHVEPLWLPGRRDADETAATETAAPQTTQKTTDGARAGDGRAVATVRD